MQADHGLPLPIQICAVFTNPPKSSVNRSDAFKLYNHNYIIFALIVYFILEYFKSIYIKKFISLLKNYLK
jgi:hypothetical protein